MELEALVIEVDDIQCSAELAPACAVGLKKPPRRRRAICPKLRRQISVCFWLPAANW